MTIEERIEKVLPILKEWERLQKSVNKTYDDYSKITLCSPESPMWESIHNIGDAYTKSISKFVSDEDEWLPWYQFDNDMGQSGLEVMLKEELVKVTCIEKLAYVICWYSD